MTTDKTASPRAPSYLMTDAYQRERAADRVRRFLARRTFPRAEMMLMLAVAGLVGFLASSLLLHVGLDSMSIRYPISVLVAYATFLLLVRGWLARHLHGRRSRLDPLDAVDIPTSGSSTPSESPPHEFGGGSFGGGGAGGSFDAPAASSLRVECALPVAEATAAETTSEAIGETASSAAGEAIGSAAESAWPLVLIVGVVAGAIVGVGMAVWAAPALLAEILVDAMIVGGVMHRLRGIETSHWAIGALRRTWLPVASLAVLLAATGWIMQAWVPEAASIGDFVGGIRAG